MDCEQVSPESTSPKPKRRRRLRRVLRALAIVLVVILLALSAILYNPVRTLATLEKVEPELAADLIDNGLYICGGGSLLKGMDTALANATGLKVQIADDPLSCVARGTGIYLENLELWKETMDRSEYGSQQYAGHRL